MKAVAEISKRKGLSAAHQYTENISISVTAALLCNRLLYFQIIISITEHNLCTGDVSAQDDERIKNIRKIEF